MNKEELQQLERESHLNKVPLLTDIYIVPTRRKHESGYKVMEIYGVNNQTGYKKLIDDYCDVFHFGETLDGLSNCVSMDILHSGVLHLWSSGYLFEVVYRLSDFTFSVVRARV